MVLGRTRSLQLDLSLLLYVVCAAVVGDRVDVQVRPRLASGVLGKRNREGPMMPLYLSRYQRFFLSFAIVLLL